MNELMINLRAEQKVPLYEQIYDYIKDDIKKGRIQSGEKLPSTRALSAHLEVSSCSYASSTVLLLTSKCALNALVEGSFSPLCIRPFLISSFI